MAEPELGLPFCGLTSSALAQAASADCRWTHNPISCAHMMDLPAANIRPDTIDRIWQECIALWNAVCNIDIRFQADPNANVLARVDAMDGPNGILGESYLPCGNVNPRTQLTQRYDTGERWTYSFLKRVILHELGHALGLPHAPQGSAVMSPYLTDFEVPQAWDINQMMQRYGAPRPTPVPTPTPVPVPTPTPTPAPTVDLFGQGGKVFMFPVNEVIYIPEPGNYLISARNPSPKKVRISMAKR